MFSIKSTSSNALAVAFLFLSLTSLCEAQFRRAATSSTASSAAALTTYVLPTAAAATDLATAATSGCPVPATVTVTVTAAPMTAGSLSSTDSPPTTLQPLSSSAVVSATSLSSTDSPPTTLQPLPSSTFVSTSSVILTPSATPLPPITTASSASSVVSPTSIVSSSSAAATPPSTTATTVSSLPATNVGSSTSSTVSPSALPARNTTEPWKPFPTDGYNLTFSDYVMANGTEVPVWLGFSKTLDSGYTNSHTQFGFTWEPAKHLVTYQLSEESTNGTDPFMLNGYTAWPMPNNTAYKFCNELHCGAGEQPCKASYQKGEIPKATADNLHGNKTSVCPDYINLNFQLCMDVWT